MTNKSSVLTVRLRRPPPVLVCKKCLGRVADGKALRKALKSELKRRGSAGGSKPPRVVLTGCLGICPKRAVAVASAATMARGEVLLLADAGAAVAAADKLLA
jgi:hypothetical protein